MAKRTRQVIAATMIVKNEEAVLARSLASLQGIVDEIHVHDTGSTDATMEIALEHGAQLTRGPWPGDFATARNAALEGWTADWALVVDADEEVVADPELLRERLAVTRAGILLCEVDNEAGGVTTSFPGGRVFRPRWAKWDGDVHEQLVGRTRPLLREDLPRALLHLRHSGYQSREVLRDKFARNLALAQAQVDALAAQGSAADPARVAVALVDLGRTQLGAGHLQEGVDTFEAIRELFPDSSAWMRATDMLAKALIGAGMADAGLFLVEQLRGAGGDPAYCDWLAAEALAGLGAKVAAHGLRADIVTMTDTSGHRYEASVGLQAKDQATRRSSQPAAA
jgi:hypothetical protein